MAPVDEFTNIHREISIRIEACGIAFGKHIRYIFEQGKEEESGRLDVFSQTPSSSKNRTKENQEHDDGDVHLILKNVVQQKPAVILP